MKKMVLFLSLLSSFALSAESGSEAAHHDWNKVSPQPVADTLKSEFPASSEILGPKFMEKISTSEVTLKWKAVEGVEYYLQVATDPKFKWLVVDTPNMTQTEYNLKNLESGKQYFWRVFTQKPKNWAGYTKGTDVRSMFEVVK